MEEKGFKMPAPRPKRGRGRGRGSGRGDTQNVDEDPEGLPKRFVPEVAADEPETGRAEIKLTNDDAAESKLSAVELGYYEDNFLRFFARVKQRRPPLINRGYFARVMALRKLIQGFLSAELSSTDIKTPKQIVCFGAGFDTTFFQLRSKGIIRDEVVYFELDFPSVVRNKMKVILAYEELFALAFGSAEGSASEEKAQLHGSNYHIAGVDLSSLSGLERTAKEIGIDPNKPTLFLSECVLIYVQPQESAAVIQWAAGFVAGVFLTYEMIRPDDPFGRMMVKNLEGRGVILPGLRARPDLQDQQESYLSLGWERVDVLDMNDVYDCFLDRPLVARAARLEIFDEMEEWRLIQGHYCIVCAVKEGSSFSGLFSNLRLVKGIVHPRFIREDM